MGNTEGALKTHKRLIIKPIVKRFGVKKEEIENFLYLRRTQILQATILASK
jgi:hypothetical protein